MTAENSAEDIDAMDDDGYDDGYADFDMDL